MLICLEMIWRCWVWLLAYEPSMVKYGMKIPVPRSERNGQPHGQLAAPGTMVFKFYPVVVVCKKDMQAMIMAQKSTS